MAAPLGVSSAVALRRGDVPLPLLRQSALSVLGERPEWMVGPAARAWRRRTHAEG